MFLTDEEEGTDTSTGARTGTRAEASSTNSLGCNQQLQRLVRAAIKEEHTPARAAWSSSSSEAARLYAQALDSVKHGRTGEGDDEDVVVDVVALAVDAAASELASSKSASREMVDGGAAGAQKKGGVGAGGAGEGEKGRHNTALPAHSLAAAPASS